MNKNCLLHNFNIHVRFEKVISNKLKLLEIFNSPIIKVTKCSPNLKIVVHTVIVVSDILITFQGDKFIKKKFKKS